MKKLISSMAAVAICVTACASSAAPDFTQAAEQTVNGVVSIKSYATYRQQSNPFGSFNDPFFEYFFGTPQQQQRQPQQKSEQERQLGLGSGVILSADGYLVTNNHVIDKAERLEVTLNDNRTFDATVVGTDPSTDLALLKIDAKGLPVIPTDNSDDLKIGEWVLAVGNPFGFTSTVTAGIVSAKARNISSATGSRSMGIESFIQTDAAVNPGNSGGALVNTKGELVGINSAIYSQTGNYAGYSFAIPASIVTKVVADIKEYGSVQRAVLGIMFSEVTPALIKEKKLEGVTEGIYVGEVVERSAALEAGLKGGDVIVEINGAAIHNSGHLQDQMARLRPGDSVNVVYVRDGKRNKTTVKLRNNQGSTSLTKAGDFTELGCALQEASSELSSRLGVKSGVEVTGLTSGKFKDAGIRKGFVILDINGTRVSTPDDVEKIYNSLTKSSNSDEKVMFITGIYSTGKKAYYAIDLATNDE